MSRIKIQFHHITPAIQDVMYACFFQDRFRLPDTHYLGLE